MATLSELIAKQRGSGQGVFGSVSTGVTEKLKEKIDPRRMFNQRGLLTALFPSLRAYKAGKSLELESVESTKISDIALSSIDVNMKIAAKNSIVLPAIHRDVNLMRQNISKLVKLSGGKPATRGDKDFFKRSDIKKSYDVQKNELSPTQVSSEAEKEGVKGILSVLAMNLINIGKNIASVVTTAIGQIKSLFIEGLGKLFSVGRLGMNFLGPLMGRILSFLVSPVGLTILAASGLFFAIKQFANDFKAGQNFQERLRQLDSIKRTRGGLTKSEQEEYDSLRKKTGYAPSRNLGRQEYPTGVTQQMLSGLSDEQIMSEFKVPRSVMEEYVKGKGKKSVFDIAKEQGIEVAGRETVKSDVVAVGDSIAKGLQGKGNIGGTDNDASTGRTPKGVYDNINQNLQKDKNYYKGKKVILSSGLSNNPEQLEYVEKQIELLKKSGADVMLLGVGKGKNNEFATQQLNSKLRTLAEQYGMRFSGPLQSIGSLESDNIHINSDKLFQYLNRNYDSSLVNTDNLKGNNIDAQSRNNQTAKTLGAESGDKIIEQTQTMKKETLDQSMFEIDADAYDTNFLEFFNN